MQSKLLAIPEEFQAAVESASITLEKQSRSFCTIPKHLAQIDPKQQFPDVVAAVAAAEKKNTLHFDPNTDSPSNRETSQSSQLHIVATPAGVKLSDAAVAATEAGKAAHAFCVAQVPTLGNWLDRLDGAINTADAVLGQAESLYCRVETLLDMTRKVKRQSDSLSANASALMARKLKLEQLLSNVSKTLKEFQSVDALYTESSQPSLNAASPRFAAMIDEMEDIALFLSKHTHYKSSAAYASRLSLAYQRAMLCLKESLNSGLNAACNNVLCSPMYGALFADRSKMPNAHINAVSSSTSLGALGSGGLKPHTLVQNTGPSNSSSSIIDVTMPSIERPSSLRAAVALVHEDFKQHLAGVLPMLRVLEARCAASEAQSFVGDVFSSLAEVCSKMVAPLIADYAQSQWKSAVEDAAASSSTVEARATAPSLHSQSHAMMSCFVDALLEHKSLYSSLFVVDDLPETAFGALVHDLADTVYHNFRTCLLSVDSVEELAQAAESLNTSFTAEALEQRCGPLGALAAPNAKRMLQDCQERLVFRTSVWIRGKIRYFPYADGALLRHCAVVCASHLSSSPDEHPRTLEPFVPIESTITLLRHLYPALDRNVFAVFASDCIHLGIDAVNRAATSIEKSPQTVPFVVPGKACARLFQIHQLLRLREALSMFAVACNDIETIVDFSALVQKKLQIQQRSRESKRDVEAELRACCEDVIKRLVDVIVFPIQKVVSSSQRYESLTEADSTVTSTIQQVLQTLKDIEKCFSVFVTTSATRHVLWGPIQAQTKQAALSLESHIAKLHEGYVMSNECRSALDAL